jgi:hypothetical protein
LACAEQDAGSAAGMTNYRVIAVAEMISLPLRRVSFGDRSMRCMQRPA